MEYTVDLEYEKIIKILKKVEFEIKYFVSDF